MLGQESAWTGWIKMKRVAIQCLQKQENVYQSPKIMHPRWLKWQKCQTTVLTLRTPELVKFKPTTKTSFYRKMLTNENA